MSTSISKEDSPNLNATAGALLAVDDDNLVSFISDQDELTNIWYQPYQISDGKIQKAEIKGQPRGKECAIFSLSHQLNLTNDMIDQFQKVI